MPQTYTQDRFDGTPKAKWSMKITRRNNKVTTEEEIPFLKDIHKLIAKTIPVIEENPFAMTVHGAVTHQPVQPRNISRKPYNGGQQSSGNNRRWHNNNQQARAK